MNKSQSEEYRLFDTLISRATDAFVFIAPEGSICSYSSAFSQLAGLKKEDIIGQNWMDVIQLYDSLEGPQLEELGTSNSPTELVSWNEPKEL